MEERAEGPTIGPLVEELERRLSEEAKRAEEYRSQLLYLQADLDNYQKRVKRDLEQMLRFASVSVLLKFLGIRDDLERSIDASEKGGGRDAFLEGIRMILGNLEEVLKSESVLPIDALGKPFNPEMHEAVAHVNRDDCEDSTITKELRKGYTLHGKVIRASMVEVSRKTLGGM